MNETKTRKLRRPPQSEDEDNKVLDSPDLVAEWKALGFSEQLMEKFRRPKTRVLSLRDLEEVRDFARKLSRRSIAKQNPIVVLAARWILRLVAESERLKLEKIKREQKGVV